MAAVTGFETLTYNGITFPTESLVTISGNQTRDQADRTTVYTTYKIHVDTVISPTAPTNFATSRANELTTLPAMKRFLATAGQPLVITGTGFGNVRILTGLGDTHEEVAWGPKPEILTWEPLGVLSAHMIWECTVRVLDCRCPPEGSARRKELLAYNFTVSHSVDEQGYTSRTIAGYAEIPMTRRAGGAAAAGNRLMPDNADLYWNENFTYPPIPPFCRRTQNQRTVSEDKRRLNFSVTDQELPANIMPAGVLECRASHTTSTQSAAFLKQTATLRASYTLRKDVSKSYSMLLFIQLLRQRLTDAFNGGARAFIPVSFTCEDPDIYGRPAGNFSFSYMYTLNSKKALQRLGLPGAAADKNPFLGVAVLAEQSGLWSPPPSAGGLSVRGGGPARGVIFQNQGSYSKWAESVRAEHSPYGILGLHQEAKDDKIVDLCESVKPVTAGTKYFKIQPPALPQGFELYMPIPKGIDSFVYFNCSLELGSTPGAIIQKKLKKGLGGGLFEEGGGVGGLLGLGFGKGRFTDEVIEFFRAGGQVIDQIVNRREVEVSATLFYEIVTIGNQPKPLKLLSIGGLPGAKIIPIRSGAGGSASRHKLAKVAERFGVGIWKIVGLQNYLLKDVPLAPAQFPPNFYVDLGEGGVEITNNGDLFL